MHSRVQATAANSGVVSPPSMRPSGSAPLVEKGAGGTGVVGLTVADQRGEGPGWGGVASVVT